MDRDEKIGMLVMLSGDSLSRDKARRLLERTRWDMNQASNMFFEMGEDAATLGSDDEVGAPNLIM